LLPRFDFLDNLIQIAQISITFKAAIAKALKQKVQRSHGHLLRIGFYAENVGYLDDTLDYFLVNFVVEVVVV
jgi:Ni,Fe-hydrogenase III large subunit